MSFLGLVFRNLLRQKIRSILTILGISIGIMAITSLMSMMSGFIKSTNQLLTATDVDITVAQAKSADIMFSSLAESKKVDLKKIEGVQDVTPVIYSLTPIEGSPYFMSFGAEVGGIALNSHKITAGKMFNQNNGQEVIIGKITSENFNLKIGDSLQILTAPNESLKIVGIYETGSVFEDGGAVIPLKTLQRVLGWEDKVSMFQIKLKDPLQAESIAIKIEESDESLATLRSFEDYNKVDFGASSSGAVNWGISVLAILIGGIIVMNTMIMSVFERTREIGVLRAVGWKRQRVLLMILLESIVLSLIGALVGMILGMAVVNIIANLKAAAGFLDPVFSLDIFFQAVLVAVLVGLGGGLYPSFRATKLSPLEALRYE